MIEGTRLCATDRSAVERSLITAKFAPDCTFGRVIFQQKSIPAPVS
jgi:hypothetical protein